jgi:hypothetical protein
MVTGAPIVSCADQENYACGLTAAATPGNETRID